MKKQLIYFSLVCCLSVFLTSCYYDVESELYPAVATGGCDTITAKYSTQVAPLIATSCATTGCHASGAQLPDLSSYTGLKGSIDRVKVRAMTVKSMPPTGPLSPCNIQDLDEWINAGALNN